MTNICLPTRRQMSKLFYKSLLFLLVIGTFFSATAQENKGKLVRKDVAKLTAKVIANADSERQKVVAIHKWITHNIAYDFKKFSGRNYDRTGTKSILRKRKAICLGYTDLFNEMCAYADLVSTMVPGYVKTLEKDACDTFYLDEHAWNAVRVDGDWYLIDNTWDAGYVEWYKPDFLTKMAKPFKKWDRQTYKYDPKFVFKPHDTYFLKSGAYFSSDHLASIPMWQLRNEPISIEEFRIDSTFYYLKTKADTKPEEVNDADLLKYVGMNDYEKVMYQGPLSYDFNRFNTYTYAGSYFYKAQKRYLEAKEDESNNAREYQTAVEDAQIAKKAAEENLGLLAQEFASNVRNNAAKAEIQEEYNDRYEDVIKRDARRYTSASRKLEGLDKKNKRNLEMKEERTDRVLEEKSFRDAEFKHRFDDIQDSIDLDSITDKLVADFRLSHDTLEDLFIDWDSQKDIFLIQIINEIDYVKEVGGHFSTLIAYRRVGFDDYDYPIQTLKAEFNPTSGSLYMDSVTVIDSIKSYHSASISRMKAFHKEYAAVNKSFKQLKKMSSERSDLDSRWVEVTNEYIELINRAGEWYEDFDDDLDITARRYKKLSSYGETVLKLIAKEMEYESPKDEIKTNYKGLVKANKHLLKIIGKTERGCQKEITKLEN